MIQKLHPKIGQNWSIIDQKGSDINRNYPKLCQRYWTILRKNNLKTFMNTLFHIMPIKEIFTYKKCIFPNNCVNFWPLLERRLIINQKCINNGCKGSKLSEIVIQKSSKNCPQKTFQNAFFQIIE